MKCWIHKVQISCEQLFVRRGQREDGGQKCCINMLGLTAHIIVLISAKGEHSLNEQERKKIDEDIGSNTFIHPVLW